MEELGIIFQGLIVGLLGKMVWQIGHLSATVDGLIGRIGSIEEWQERIRKLGL